MYPFSLSLSLFFYDKEAINLISIWQKKNKRREKKKHAHKAEKRDRKNEKKES